MMHVYERNREIFSYEKSHPARRFLEAFIDCRTNCVGREIAISTDRPPIDQAWFSARDGKWWKFSEFAYVFLAFDVELDGWLNNAAAITESERTVLSKLSYLRELMAECHKEAAAENNTEIVDMVKRVVSLLDLWEQCITERLRKIRA